ncbi:MAG: hypothetical protein KBC22_02685 [Candidatus Pacebacteria bacterium]|nr:hypothetical protein [Candidatus Paceibacterota bacterium]
MKDMKKTGVLATAAQKARIFAIFVAMLYELLERLTFDTAQALLTKEGEKEVKKRFMEHLNIEIDPWSTQKANLERFWLTVFNYQINWSDYVLPEYSDRYSHLNIRPTGFTAEQIYAGIKNCTKFTFKKRTKYMDNIDKALREAKAVQSRPTGNYAWADGGTAEPDQEHLNKSYDDSINANLIFMGPVEYLLSCALYEFLTGKVYDIKGATRLSVLDSGGYALFGGWYGGDGSYLVWSDRGFRFDAFGPRVVVFTS